MFNIGPGELMAIAAVALIVLGPQRLPQALRQVGKFVGELRRISGGFQDELRRAIEESELTTDPDEREAQPSAAGAIETTSIEAPAAADTPGTPGTADAVEDADAERAESADAEAGIADAVEDADAEPAEPSDAVDGDEPETMILPAELPANGDGPSDDERAAS